MASLLTLPYLGPEPTLEDVGSTDPFQQCPLCGERYPSDFRVCPRDATPLGLPSTQDDPLVGTVLAGTYRIGRVLATGGMGRVYVGEHIRLERRVAVKVIHEQYAGRPDSVARFEREARAAGRIQSDHIVDVFDIMRTPDGRPAIVAELLEGEDLQSRLDHEDVLAPGIAVSLARQICRGLLAAHAHGVVHRDLKPSNIFLAARPDGRVTVKIVDFGIAKLSGAPNLTKSNAVLGTPSYMAPEQARGSAAVDARADVYAVGAVLYRMLTGRAPYGGDEPTATLIELIERAPKRPRAIVPNLPEELEYVVLRAMARDVRARYRTVKELEEALAELDAHKDAGIEIAAPKRTLGDGTVGTQTLVLPGGSILDAAMLLERTRRARRTTIVVAGLACGALTLLGSLWAVNALPTASWRTRAAVLTTLALLLGLAATRYVHMRWSSARKLELAARRIRHALLCGFAALGVALFAGHAPLSITPRGHTLLQLFLLTFGGILGWRAMRRVGGREAEAASAGETRA